MIFFALWRRGLLRRADREKLGYFLGVAGGPLTLSRRYPLWRILRPFRLLLNDPRFARVPKVLETPKEKDLKYSTYLVPVPLKDLE